MWFGDSFLDDKNKRGCQGTPDENKDGSQNIVLLTLNHLKQLVTAESFVTVAMTALDYTETMIRYFQIFIAGKNVYINYMLKSEPSYTRSNNRKRIYKCMY
jgi:hypothetical protein